MAKIHYLSIPALENVSALRHAFTTRQSGLGARINGIKRPGDWNSIAEVFGIDPDRLITVNQVHGDTIVEVGEDPPAAAQLRQAQADAIITNIPGIAIGVETADCVPILLYDPGAGAIAAVHAGWKSTLKRIVQKAAIRMRDVYGSDPHEMIAAIGPAIGPECYEVDETVMGPARSEFPLWKKASSPREHGRWSLDLVCLNRFQLADTGLASKNIHALGLCTSCRSDLFYSFRAEGRTGRMLSVIMLKP
ncbi:MAG TPA: peptidoglycan editing factor PgeF [Nitrospiraceae bacterium]|nr:peptidoglycan editing factor PgeF [Nitrospiraceae bacterium]